MLIQCHNYFWHFVLQTIQQQSCRWWFPKCLEVQPACQCRLLLHRCARMHNAQRWVLPLQHTWVASVKINCQPGRTHLGKIIQYHYCLLQKLLQNQTLHQMLSFTSVFSVIVEVSFSKKTKLRLLSYCKRLNNTNQLIMKGHKPSIYKWKHLKPFVLLETWKIYFTFKYKYILFFLFFSSLSSY